MEFLERESELARLIALHGRAANGEGHYKNSPEAIANGAKGQDWLREAKQQGKTVDYKKHDVFIEDPEKGCIRKKKSVSTPWIKK